MKLHLTPVADMHCSYFHIRAYKSFPNTSLRPTHPLIIYHSAFHVVPNGPISAPSSLSAKTTTTTASASEFAEAVEHHLRSTGIVQPAWRYTMYTTHHYHSTTDEVLVITSPRGGRLCFGGAPNEEFEEAVEVDVVQGDVLLVPAGVGHALVAEHPPPSPPLTATENDDQLPGEGFQMVGSYPSHAAEWDMCTHDDDEGGAADHMTLVAQRWKRIRKLQWFAADPVYGTLHTPGMREYVD